MKAFMKMAVLILPAMLAVAPVVAQGSGADTYRMKCAMCHGADGLATTPTAKNFKVVSFKDPEMVKASDAEFIASTADGKGKMPAYKGKLTDAQIKDVIMFIRTLQK
jgi:cytochrome c6